MREPLPPAPGARPGGYDKAIHGGREIAFMYRLLRDHLTSGVIEGILIDLEGNGEPTAFSDDFLAARAIELNARIHGVGKARALEVAHDAIRHAQMQPQKS